MWYGSLMTEFLTDSDRFIRALGVEAYRVGGSVRDQILGRRVKDCDYMVRGVALEPLRRIIALAHPNAKITPLQDRERRPLGWRVAQRGIGMVEITLPRVEVSTGPGHRDFDITLDPELPLSEDAKRRDFTFNALYFGVHGGPGSDVVIDPTARGLYDLQHMLVRTTHPSSFRDDPLRTLRALRFVSTLGYDLTADTREQMCAHADAVSGLTAPKVVRKKAKSCKCAPGCAHEKVVGSGGGTSGTVYEEFSRILMGPDVSKALGLAADTGVLSVVMPELAPMIGFGQRSRYHDMTTDRHTFKALETAAHVDAPLRVRWALLFHDSGKPDAAWLDGKGLQHYYARKGKMIRPSQYEMLSEDHEVCSERRWRQACVRMNVPREMREEVATLVRHHMVTVAGKVKGTKVRRMRVQFGDDLLRDLFLHRMCDLSGKGVKVAQNHIAQVATMERLRQEAAAQGVPCSTKDLAIRGKDAVALGMRGEWIGGALSVILDDVVCEPTPLKRSREWQMEQLQRAAQHRARIDKALERS
jgi:tRNA nucleotidyltransferase (CCA-adding enzyme)